MSSVAVRPGCSVAARMFATASVGCRSNTGTSAIVWSLLRQVSVTVRGDRTGGNAASVVDSVLVFDEGREVKTVSELVLLYDSGLGVQANFGEFGLAGQ